MSDQKSNSLPAKGATATDYKSFFETFFNDKATARREWINEMYLAKLMIESSQWVEPSPQTRPGQTPRWTEQIGESADNIPKPVTNEILKIVDGEVGRLRNRKSKPKIRSRQSNNDGVKMGAKRGEDILESYLEDIRW